MLKDSLKRTIEEYGLHVKAIEIVDTEYVDEFYTNLTINVNFYGTMASLIVHGSYNRYSPSDYAFDFLMKDVQCIIGSLEKGYLHPTMIKDGTVLKRNGNLFIVRKDRHGNYYTALLIGRARVTAWHRTSKRKMIELYTIADYEKQFPFKI